MLKDHRSKQMYFMCFLSRKLLLQTDSLNRQKSKIVAVNVIENISGLKKNTTPVLIKCNLSANVTLCKGSMVTMMSNPNVEDGLVSGVMGTALRIIEGSKPPRQPQCVCVRFDNDQFGIKPVPYHQQTSRRVDSEFFFSV